MFVCVFVHVLCVLFVFFISCLSVVLRFVLDLFFMLGCFLVFLCAFCSALCLFCCVFWVGWDGGGLRGALLDLLLLDLTLLLPARQPATPVLIDAPSAHRLARQKAVQLLLQVAQLLLYLPLCLLISGKPSAAPVSNATLAVKTGKTWNGKGARHQSDRGAKGRVDS